MKKILLVVTLLWFTCPAQGAPITWRFSGITNASSQYIGSPIGGLNFELRIFLDTDLVGTTVGSLSDVFFAGPHQGEIEISGFSQPLPLNQFLDVQHFASSGVVTGVQYRQPAFSGIQFASSISSDPLHLTPISPVAPNSFNTIEFVGPNGLNGRGAVSFFSATLATTSAPEGGTTAGMICAGLVAVTLVRWRSRAFS
jgi:hypothetical protein